MLPTAGKSLRMPFVVFKCGNDIQVCKLLPLQHPRSSFWTHLLAPAFIWSSFAYSSRFFAFHPAKPPSWAPSPLFFFPIQIGYAMSRPEKRLRCDCSKMAMHASRVGV